ncbi:hypothetical protein TKK_0008604 [Trichogramma kaykai]
MSLHYYPQATYRYRSAAQQQQHLHREQLHQQQQCGSDSDGNDYSEYDNGDEEEADNGDEEEDEDEEDDEDEDGELDDDPDLPYAGFVPVALKYLHQTTRPRNWCLCLITNPYPFSMQFMCRHLLLLATVFYFSLHFKTISITRANFFS